MVRLVPTAAEYEEMLRGADLRVTQPRLAVLSAVFQNPHADAHAITLTVRDGLGEVSHQTIYNALGALTGAGLLRLIQPPDSPARYESRVRDNHHHLVCRTCGAIEDVDCAVGAVPCLTPSDDHGFEIDEAEVVFRGICPRCSQTSAHDPRTPETPETTKRRNPDV